LVHNERLIQAVQRATRKLVSSGNFDLLMKDVLAICVEAVGASGGTIYVHDAETKRLRFQHVLPESVNRRLPANDIPEDYGMAGEAFTTHQTICREFPPKPANERTEFEISTGVTVHSMVATPLTMENETPIGVVQLLNKREGVFTLTDCAVLDTIAAVATMAFMNYRLTEESVRASSLLGMGKVAHDIGNLAASLSANLNFSDLAVVGLQQRLPKGDEGIDLYMDSLVDTLGDLRLSADGILGYSRLMSDISAGRQLRPNMVSARMSETVRSAAEHLEPEARASDIQMRYEIDADAPATLHDPLFVNRIVQNLVGNAIKAVKETDLEQEKSDVLGEVCVRYCFANGIHVIEVADTGPGIPPETIQRILSGNARSQWERASGSGWGTKIVLELAASHNAKLSIDSDIGQGSTFRVEIPHRTA
jgi:signal transduction histidine kinase